jgi:hypothetical protein
MDEKQPEQQTRTARKKRCINGTDADAPEPAEKAEEPPPPRQKEYPNPSPYYKVYTRP